MSSDNQRTVLGEDVDNFNVMMQRSDPDGAPNLAANSQQQTFNNGRLSPATRQQSSPHVSDRAKFGVSLNKSKSTLDSTISTSVQDQINFSRANANGGASNISHSGGGGSGPILGLGSVEHKIRPGEFVMRVLFSEFTTQAEKKIEYVMTESPERSLSKSLQRGEDLAFDQLLVALGSVSEHCLPSILRTLFSWYDRQAVAWLGNPMVSGSVSSGTSSSITSSMEYVEKEQISLDPHVVERRDMAVEFIFCLVLIEVLKQLPFHPGHHDLIGKIEDLAFAHFKYREGAGMNAANGLVIADLYAEVLGALAQARFGSVRVRFLSELAELRGKEATASVTQSIVSLLMGMKFFRIKMAPIEDFEAAFLFLAECAKYFLEVKQRDIKHALAGLFVEILVPVAATVKHEVNVPCLKSFMEMLYVPTLDMCTRSKHRLALFPLVTCLLCVSQRPFFLQNWHYFLAMCLSQLKSKEPKMSRVALESLYRLLWAYMIRIKCESNSATQSRLLSVVNSLFPKGSKGVVPRDTPLNIFVKIIQFIAQERLDFAMREIVFELLSVGRPIKIILTPERMNIGLRAFLVAADSLQQKDGDPPMPRSVGIMPSGNTLLRVKKTFLNKVLTEDAAKSIGMASYFPRIRKVFTDILRALDLQCGRPLMLTSVKEQEENLLTGDRKAKIDLFRTCVAAIPRLIPDGMSRTELLSLLSRLTLHIDEELRGLAFQSLQCLLMDFPDWRNDVLAEFVAFTSKEVPDSAPQQLDNALRMLLQLLTSWKLVLTSNGFPDLNNKTNGNEDEKEKLTVTAASTMTSAKMNMSGQRYGSGPSIGSGVKSNSTGTYLPNLQTFHQAEGLALVILCSVRSSSRRLGAHMLKEIKALSEILGLADPPVLDVLDKICPSCCEKVSNLNILPPSEKQAVLSAVSTNSLDLQWITERSCPAWYTQQDEEVTVPALSSSLTLLQSPVSTHPTYSDTSASARSDPWALCLKEFLDYQNIPTKCSRSVVEAAWSMLMPKITALYTYLEPSPVADNRASLLRSTATPRKPPTDRNLYFKLWRNYLLFAFRTVPVNVGLGATLRCISPEMGISSSPEAVPERDGKSPLPISSAVLCSVAPSSLYKLLLPLIRSEAADIRDLAVRSLGIVNHLALKDFFEDFAPYMREACDRKQENMRRRKRKDNLRLQIVRILKLMAKEKTFSRVTCLSNLSSHSSYIHGGGGGSSVGLPVPFIEFLEMSRGWLESETDRENGTEIRVQFCKSIHYLLSSFEIEYREILLKKEIRKQLFNLCIGWAGPYAHPWGKDLNTSTSSSSSGSTANVGFSPGTAQCSELEFAALQAAAGLLTCGPCFQQSLLPEESQLYSWIDFLLTSTDCAVSDLAEQMIILLLEYNPDVGSVLDWAVSRCFTGSPQIGNACFRAIVTLFSAREYPCDRYVAIINTALLYSGNANVDLQQLAFRLLQVLDRRFFGGLPAFHLHSQGNDGRDDYAPNTLDGVLGKTQYAKSQTFLSRQLSILHPELTMPMFSEISWRMKSARSDVRQSLLRYIQPWLHNMELVEPAIPSPNVITPLANFTGQSVSSSSSCLLCGRKYYDAGDRLMRRGWGSTEATEMVLNNLLYLTAKFGEEHDREVEECWQTLCCLSTNNQRVVLCYLLIVTGLAPSEILPHAKRVLVYLFRACPGKLLEDLMAELQTVESLNWLVERTETPPFYRLSHLRKTSSYSDTQPALCASGGLSAQNQIAPANANNQFTRLNTSELEKGTIHTKRRSAEESTVFQQPPHLRSSSSGTGNLFRTEKARTISGPAALPDKQFLASEREKARSALYETEVLYTRQERDNEEKLYDQHHYPSSETIAAGSQGFTGNAANSSSNSAQGDEAQEQEAYNSKLVPLPMPEYGGYYAPLKEFFPAQPVSPYHRCNLALMFVSELVNEGTVISVLPDDARHKKFEWCNQYLPLLIHMAFLGLDHLRPLVHQHSYNILMNVLVVVGSHRNHLCIAKMLLNQHAKDLNMGLSLPMVAVPNFNFLDSTTEFATTGLPSRLPTAETLNVISPSGGSPNHSPKSESPRTPSRRAHSPINLLLVIPEPQESSHVKRPLTIQELTLAFIKFLAEHRGQPLWGCEDITAKLWNIRSATQLFAFLQNSLKIFASAFPSSDLEKRWSQVSLQIGLACSSRHYAGRSLQVYRALRVPLVSRTLCDILSRLVETVAESGDDMQGYVTELILTLETSVEAIPKDFHDNIQWTNNDSYYNDDIIEPDSNFKSTSTLSRDKGELSPPLLMRARSGTETFGAEARKQTSDLSRSRSAQSLNGFQQLGNTEQEILDRSENGSEVISQVFWLALSLLESDFEHEYLLALRLLEKVMERLPLDRLDCRDKLERIQAQLQWTGFGGAIPLILKGCTNPNTYEQSLSVLCYFIPSLDLSFIDATGENGFPLAVMALMPYLLTHYEDPPLHCLEAAQLIAEVAGQKGNNGSQPLHHLATVMTLYSRRAFTKESFQWNKCVIKYLYDSYSHLAPILLGFLLDVLEKGPVLIHSAVLAALYCSFNYVDLTTVGTVSPELLKAIQKHIDGPNYREALKILKLVVTRSSSLVAPTPPMPFHAGNSGPPSMAWDTVSTTSSAFSSDLELNLKKELPGRTMEFTFDVSQTPVIGRRHLSDALNSRLSLGGFANNSGGLTQRSSSVGEIGIPSASSGILPSAWKRPWQCQSRVRECLVSVLNACGQRVGLPKSPSVIFSQSSELLERQSSVASSTEEMSVAINDASGASRLDEGSASDAHFRVFRDFDFLEYELESVDGDSSDNFNWGVRRRPLSEVGTEPETEGEADNEMAPNPASCHSQSSSDQTTMIGNTVTGSGHVMMQLNEDYLGLGITHNVEESSDEDDIGLSPLDEAVPQLQGLISDPPTPQPHSLTMIEIASLSQISSPARSRRLSDTSIDSRSEEETTPSKVSPQGEFNTEGDGDREDHIDNENVPEIDHDEREIIGTASSINMQGVRTNPEERPNIDLVYDSS